MIAQGLLIRWRLLLLVFAILLIYRARALRISIPPQNGLLPLWIALTSVLPGHFHKW
ncbi:MAG TPA: hypothetical protein VM782_20435 [Stellaceae bacterium]|nr:hypothetical protein [Stellaceae bacterium]